MNRRLAPLLFVVGLFVIAVPETASAIGLPFGGKIMAVPQDIVPDAICPGVSFSLEPKNAAPPGPYLSYSTAVIEPEAEIIGHYIPMAGPCFIMVGPIPVPIPTFIVHNPAGTSAQGSNGQLSSGSGSPSLAGEPGGGDGGGGFMAAMPSFTDLPDTTGGDNEVYVTPECDDLEDNDNDGLTDWFMDPDCYGPDDTGEGNTIQSGGTVGANITECNDGVDNDNDGFTDLSDNGCINGADTTEFSTTTQVPQSNQYYFDTW